MQQGQHELDRIPQPPLGFMSGDDIFTNFRAFNISYADTGIFGIYKFKNFAIYLYSNNDYVPPDIFR